MASRRIAVTSYLLFFFFLFLQVPLAAGAAPGSSHDLETPPGQGFLFPSDVEVDGQGVVFVLDSGRRSVFLFSPEGKFVREISGKGTWKDPQGMALIPDRGILVADGNAGRVLELDLSGAVRREYPLGKGARATDAAYYGDLVYCLDNRNAKVLVFKRNGDKAGGWGKPGEGSSEFSSPFRLTIDMSGRVFVTDVMNSRVQWFSAFGQLLGTIRAFGAGRGKLLRPSSVTVDGRGGVWIGDSYTGYVQRFDEKGNAVGILQADGRGPAIFGDPSGIAKSPSGIWVADQMAKKVTYLRQ